MLRTKAVYQNNETERERKHRQQSYRAALEGIVLLENDGAMPVKPGKIALYGAGAAMTIKGGTGSGEVNERYSVSILEGLERAGYTITTMKWLNDYARMFKEEQEAYAAIAAKKIRKLDIINLMAEPFKYPHGREISHEDIEESDTDTCIYVVARQAGEGADRKLDNGEYNLTDIERVNIMKCAEAYKKTIVVINVGASFDVSFVYEIPGINALVYFCQQGTEGGTAFADILSGKAVPSGKLTDTWARTYDDIPFACEYSYLNGDLQNEYYKEGIYVGYRYFDTFKVKPQYEFGYGLSYTQFHMGFVNAVIDKTKATIRVKVQNIGDKYAGKEVVQLYVSCPQNKLHKEYQRLAAFAKTKELKPGEAQELDLDIDMRALSSYDEESASFILEQGDYIVRLGNSSRNTVPCAVISLDNDVTVSKHANICRPQLKLQEIEPPKVAYDDDLQNVVKLTASASDFETVTYEYKEPPVYSDQRVDEIMKRLTLKDMVELVVGAGMFGKTYFTCPGAVGNTTSKIVKKGIINIALSDGPAGLRLQKTSTVTKKGKVKMIDAHIEFMNYLPKLIKKFMFGNPNKDTLIYQFTTAFPVELALAQTWNTELLEEIGRAISVEMAEYGVTYWLAPAMNIHRNPLCGRNFEYYSEDPYLTGKMAAAVTKGCQSIEGNYVTIKHFCANNQEDNRNKVSSNVNERALREIYLRGFEIAVREAGAKGVMTSYNKVNGTYTPNSHDLCTKVLRNEWGFDGVVMTDWFSTGKGLANNGLCMKAGNDLIMPGGRRYKKEILAELKKGTINEKDIRRCAANVLRSILNSNLAKEYKLH
ncbi:glycoside hydrolase family 3 protein [Clostridium thermarum]|uniref:glycoside hydrolase family 3 protein n=1 Tax=Clostridium thermarum TaxID=1716543 RepID=UPI0013D0DB97|nr:glycoside hydrolase family 3 protein [Clostridium thermarum]